MDEKRIRLECMKLAVAVAKTKSALKITDEQLGEKFAEFCASSEIHLESLSAAVKATHPSTTIDGILDTAMRFAGFAHRTKGYEEVASENRGSDLEEPRRGKRRPRKT